MTNTGYSGDGGEGSKCQILGCLPPPLKLSSPLVPDHGWGKGNPTSKVSFTSIRFFFPPPLNFGQKAQPFTTAVT